MIRSKEDVSRCYHDVCRRRDVDCPHVKVKVYRRLEDVDFTGDCDIPDGLTLEWIRANLSDETLDELFWLACEGEWEMLRQDAEEVFGPGVEVEAGGRMGGWACVSGLDDIADWDAVALAKWKRFARYAGQYARNVPEQMVYIIAGNQWARAQEKALEDAGIHVDVAPVAA